MNNRRTDYWARAGAECWREASAQFPVLLLTGPRQVGKTTLLRHRSAANRRYVTLDDLAARELARRCRLAQRGADAVEPGGGCDPGGLGVSET